MDPYCHEALDRLIGNNLLPREKEVDLLAALKLHEEDECPLSMQCNPRQEYATTCVTTVKML